MGRHRCVAWSLNRSAISCSIVLALAIAAWAPPVHAQSQRAVEVLNQRLLPLFELAGVVYTSADETTGRYVVGVMDRDVEGLVRARLPGLGVLSRMVDVVETEPIFQLETLRDKVRPVEAGLQIRFSQYVCSLGFNAERNGVAGFVTASHCSTKQGQVDGTLYYQPLNQVSDEFIGTEIADPAYVRGVAGCPRGKVCRYSDANFSRGADGVSFTLGGIAKTTGANNGSLEISGGFTITDEGPATVGQTANKVGRTTGWTAGTVTNTCVNTAVSGSKIVLLCQDFVTAGVGGGDSGSPVFRITSGNKVTLLGNLWGGNQSGTMFVYSPMANIEQELGTLTTH